MTLSKFKKATTEQPVTVEFNHKHADGVYRYRVEMFAGGGKTFNNKRAETLRLSASEEIDADMSFEYLLTQLIVKAEVATQDGEFKEISRDELEDLIIADYAWAKRCDEEGSQSRNFTQAPSSACTSTPKATTGSTKSQKGKK